MIILNLERDVYKYIIQYGYVYIYIHDIYACVPAIVWSILQHWTIFETILKHTVSMEVDTFFVPGTKSEARDAQVVVPS